MSTFNRLSLHDCKIELRIPILDTLPPPPAPNEPPLTLEDQALHAATTSTRDMTEAYIGETIFLLLTIQPPEGITHSFDALYTALESCDDAHVTILNQSELDISPPLTDPKNITPSRLPILRESTWVMRERSSTSSTPGPALLCKGVWALVRTPPEASHHSQIFALAGRHNIEISLRERPTATTSRNSPVWATIDRASRLFGKTISLRASRPILLSMPLIISCRHVSISGSADKNLVSISARNATSDATIAVVPPYVNVGASQLVDESEFDEKGNPIETNEDIDSVKNDDLSSNEINVQSFTNLGRRFEFIPLFDVEDESSNEDEEITDTANKTISPPNENETDTHDDYGLFIPSFNHWLQKAVNLGPREVFVFVFKIVERDNVTASSGDNEEDALTTVENEKTKKDSPASANVNNLRLKQGFCIETSIAVAWKCFPRENNSAVEAALEQNEPLRRELSSGAVLATGKRGNVAVRLAKVQWRPASLLESVVVTFSGPSTATVGSKLIVSMSIVNQTEKVLEKAVIMIQRDDATNDLLTLRTVIAVGDIAPRGETSLQLPCIALRVGTLGLGTVRVVEGGVGGRVQWESESEFRVVVVESDDFRPVDVQDAPTLKA